MTDSDQKSTFQLFDEGTMFGGRHYWLGNTGSELLSAVGLWSW